MSQQFGWTGSSLTETSTTYQLQSLQNCCGSPAYLLTRKESNYKRNTGKNVPVVLRSYVTSLKQVEGNREMRGTGYALVPCHVVLVTHNFYIEIFLKDIT